MDTQNMTISDRLARIGFSHRKTLGRLADNTGLREVYHVESGEVLGKMHFTDAVQFLESQDA